MKPGGQDHERLAWEPVGSGAREVPARIGADPNSHQSGPADGPLAFVPVAPDLARPYFEDSLSSGTWVSEAVRDSGVLDSGKFTVIALPSLVVDHPDDLGGVHQIPHWVFGLFSKGDKWFRRRVPWDFPIDFLDAIIARAAAGTPSTGIAEDAIGNASYVLPGNYAFCGSSLLRWGDMASVSGVDLDTMAVTDIFEHIFVVGKTPAELGLVHGEQAPSSLGEDVAQSLRALTLDAFDGESFVVWTSDDVQLP